MLDVIQAIADARPEEKNEHLATLEYLKACNKLFENGILSHNSVDRLSSKVMKNIDEGYAYFKKWKDSIPKGNSGAHERSLFILCLLRNKPYRSDTNKFFGMADMGST